MALALQPIEEAAISDLRARELSRYFIPLGSNQTHDIPSQPDTTLTTFAQLAAWRCDAQRGTISLIDREMQHFVAEATKTVMLDDETKYDDPGDAIWAGCCTVPKAGRLCEYTIAAPEPEEGMPSYFEIQDLAVDPRFKELPFVVGPPGFRYYCGVPIRSSRGVNIGSLFVLDVKPKAPVARPLIDFLATLANNILLHLDALMDRKKLMNMNFCLASYVDPASTSMTLEPQNSSKSLLARKLFNRTAEPVAPPTPRANKTHWLDSVPESPSGDVRANEASPSPALARDDPMDPIGEADEDVDERRGAIRRAASLLCDALDLKAGGSVMFVDSMSINGNTLGRGTGQAAEDEAPASGKDAARCHGQPPGQNKTKSRTIMQGANEHVSDGRGSRSVLEVLAVATAGGTTSEDRSSPTISEQELAYLINQFPKGHLFKTDTPVRGSEEDPTIDVRMTDRVTLAQDQLALSDQEHIAMLQQIFPQAHQVIFVPIWDALISRYIACFACNNSKFRALIQNPDYLFSVAFCNCLAGDISRIATLASDQQKGDFISSVSHEMRSPLHGILGACEFLAETETTPMQQSLIKTADSCARTLLDTINMVLDFSKINFFEKKAESEIASEAARGSGSSTTLLRPTVSLYSSVDLAATTEEVIEGICSGHARQSHLSGLELPELQSTHHETVDTVHRRNVDLVIDIAAPPFANAWMCETQPGAYRRIIMNLVGNSLKFTSQGYIKVSLAIEPRRPRNATNDSKQQLITLTISDTGQGISAEFIRNRLYTPFSQEDGVSNGPGLGLALVKSLVGSLDGEISIESTQGQGTQVTVRLPMTRSAKNPDGDRPGFQRGISDRVPDDPFSLTRTMIKGRRALIFPAEVDSSIDPIRLPLRAVCRDYLQQWLDFEIINTLSRDDLPDIIFSNENALSELQSIIPDILTLKGGPIVLCTCSTRSWQSRQQLQEKSPNLEYIDYPFGPIKFSQNVKYCLEKLEGRDGDGGVDEVAKRDMLDPDTLMVSNLQRVENPALIDDGSVDSSVGTSVAAISEMDVEEFVQRELAARAEGSITLSSPEPSSTQLRTPTSQDPSASTLPPPPFGPTTHQKPPSRRTPTLLLVDDNDINIRLLQMFMKKHKYTDVRLAKDGIQAVDSYRASIRKDPPEPPDIIFMDITMPNMNGFEATRRIRALEREFLGKMGSRRGGDDSKNSPFPDGVSAAPEESVTAAPAPALIIALTGLASERHYREATACGIDVYLVKPARFKEVGRVLKKWELGLPIKHGGFGSTGPGTPVGELDEMRG